MYLINGVGTVIYLKMWTITANYKQKQFSGMNAEMLIKNSKNFRIYSENIWEHMRTEVVRDRSYEEMTIFDNNKN